MLTEDPLRIVSVHLCWRWSLSPTVFMLVCRVGKNKDFVDCVIYPLIKKYTHLSRGQLDSDVDSAEWHVVYLSDVEFDDDSDDEAAELEDVIFF